MNKLLIKIIILIMPYALYLAIPLYVLLATNELYYDLDNIVTKIISGSPHMVGFAVDQSPYKYMKYKMLTTLPRQDVVAIGSSRVLQFRDKMFAHSNFYNAGFTIDTITDFITFMSLISDDKIPKTLIVGLDQWMFNKNYNDLNHNCDKNVYLGYKHIDLESVFKASKTIYKSIYDGSISLRDISKYYDYGGKHAGKNDNQIKYVGLNACIIKSGFLNDGSMHYGMQIDKLLAGDATADDHKFKNTFKRINKGISRFQYEKDANLDAIRKLRLFLDFCKTKNIFVIALLPPFADSVYNKMNSSGNYKYLHDLNLYLPPLFLEYGYEFYDFSSFSSSGSTDDEAIDGFHGSEAVYLNMLIKMLNAGSRLNQFCDVKVLRNVVKNKINRYTVFEYK